jgi:Na+-driven multidrug efflux pump
MLLLLLLLALLSMLFVQAFQSSSPYFLSNNRVIFPTSKNPRDFSRIFRTLPQPPSQLLNERDSNDPIIESSRASNSSTTEQITTNESKSNTTNGASDVPSYPSTPTFRECLSFALPALGIYACPPLMSLIDAAFIGRTSSIELAALGPASRISDSAPLPLLFLSIAATNLIAKSYAQNDKITSTRVSRLALMMGSFGGIILSVLLYKFALPISLLYCGESQATAAAATAKAVDQMLSPLCAEYVKARAVALPAVVVATVAQSVCIGTKDTKTPMISVALAGILNLIGDIILVSWLGKGIAGAAWATSFSQVVAAGLLLRVLKKRNFLLQQPPPQQQQQQNSTGLLRILRPTKSTIQTMKQIFTFVPFLFIMAVKIGWHDACTATAASLGGADAAAHTALLSVGMLCFTFGDVGSSLSQAFLPAFVRDDNDTNRRESTIQQSRSRTHFDLGAAFPTIRQLMKCTLSISTSVMMIASVVIGMFGNCITNDPIVLRKMKQTIPWVVTSLSLHGSAVFLEGYLVARKKLPSLAIFYSMLACTIYGFQFLTKRYNLGLFGVWTCYIWVCGIRVIVFSILGGLLFNSNSNNNNKSKTRI